MNFPDSLFPGNDNEPLRTFVQNLLDTVKEQSALIEKQSARIDKLVEENEQFRAEIRHLKKHKGKPKIKSNVPDPDDQKGADYPQ